MTVGNTATFNSDVTISSTPTEPTHATNKAYVDSGVSTLSAAITSAEDAANAYTNTQVSNLINSAPGALDTLNELAAALGDDANFSSTVVNNIATAKSEAIATASADATAKADAAEVSAEAKDVVRAAAANAYADQAEADAIATAATDATTKADAAEASAIAIAATDATTKADAAEASAIATAAAALSTAVANIESSISTTRFHSSVTDVTNESTLAYTFTDLQGAEDYAVYVNRMLVRPSELTSVNLSTGVVTFASSVITDGDEIEVTGWKFS
jgi:hypothetical protein